MTQDKNNVLHYRADNGKTFKEKKTKRILGTDIFLSKDDKIENYTEVKIPKNKNA